MTKSDKTREKILAEARNQFNQKGYADTTIRQIATCVNCDPALIIRYFKSKEGLFTQAAAFELNLPDLSQIETSKRAKTLALQFVELWEGKKGIGLKILLRAAASNDIAVERIQTGFTSQVIPVLSKDDTISQLAAGKISAYVLGLAYTRYILKLPVVANLSQQELVSWVEREIQQILNNN